MKRVIEYVDKAKVISGIVLQDSSGNVIPPEYQSTGSKTAICIYESPNMIFNLTQMGDNALAFISLLTNNRDITALTYRMLLYHQMIDVDFHKDYERVDISDSDIYDEYFEEWLEEIYND